MENKQTAVEWFFDKLKNHEIQAEHFKLYQQAKAMEREQIEEAYLQGIDSILEVRNEKEYYKETYGK